MKTQPIKPSDIFTVKSIDIPDKVIISFNKLIAKNYNNGESVVKRNEIVNEIVRLMPNINRLDVLNKKWLDVEELYQKEGWIVEYDKPGFNEEYEAYFTFKINKNFKVSE